VGNICFDKWKREIENPELLMASLNFSMEMITKGLYKQTISNLLSELKRKEQTIKVDKKRKFRWVKEEILKNKISLKRKVKDEKKLLLI
jgi:hypothetical protein